MSLLPCKSCGRGIDARTECAFCNMKAKLELAEAAVAEMKPVLEWYADPTNYKLNPESQTRPIDVDGGRKARDLVGTNSLPLYKTCSDCKHFAHCSFAFNQEGASIECRWTPRRFEM